MPLLTGASGSLVSAEIEAPPGEEERSKVNFVRNKDIAVVI